MNVSNQIWVAQFRCQFCLFGWVDWEIPVVAFFFETWCHIALFVHLVKLKLDLGDRASLMEQCRFISVPGTSSFIEMVTPDYKINCPRINIT